MRYLVSLVCVLALGVMPMVGCSDEETAGGEGGNGGMVTCEDNVCPCTEAGIRAAIAEGGGPFTFECEASPPATSVYVSTEAEIVIDNDVILDGEGILAVSGDVDHTVFVVRPGVSVTLSNLWVVGGFEHPRRRGDTPAGGIYSEGDLTLKNCLVGGNYGVGIYADSGSTLTLTQSEVAGNSETGIFASSGDYGAYGFVTITSSSVWNNAGGGAVIQPPLRVTNSTFSRNLSFGLLSGWEPVELTNSTVVSEMGLALDVVHGPLVFVRGSIIRGGCRVPVGFPLPVSAGYNIESPGDTCGFDPDGTDLVEVTEAELNLGLVDDNGGPTITRKPGDGGFGSGSVAIDAIPEADCVDEEGALLTTDQRGEPRPETGGTDCDVGAVEVQADE